MHKKLFIGLVLFGLLTALLAACGIRDTGANTGPSVHMGATSFLQDSITVKKGEMLNLIDDASSTHVIVNGTWTNGVAKPMAESGAPTVNVTYSGLDSMPVGPFPVAGTFHLYCTIHQNMNLTVMVM